MSIRGYVELLSFFSIAITVQFLTSCTRIIFALAVLVISIVSIVLIRKCTGEECYATAMIYIIGVPSIVIVLLVSFPLLFFQCRHAIDLYNTTSTSSVSRFTLSTRRLTD